MHGLGLITVGVMLWFVGLASRGWTERRFQPRSSYLPRRSADASPALTVIRVLCCAAGTLFVIVGAWFVLV